MRKASPSGRKQESSYDVNASSFLCHTLSNLRLACNNSLHAAINPTVDAAHTHTHTNCMSYSYVRSCELCVGDLRVVGGLIRMCALLQTTLAAHSARTDAAIRAAVAKTGSRTHTHRHRCRMSFLLIVRAGTTLAGPPIVNPHRTTYSEPNLIYVAACMRIVSRTNHARMHAQLCPNVPNESPKITSIVGSSPQPREMVAG